MVNISLEYNFVETSANNNELLLAPMKSVLTNRKLCDSKLTWCFHKIIFLFSRLYCKYHLNFEVPEFLKALFGFHLKVVKLFSEH